MNKRKLWAVALLPVERWQRRRISARSPGDVGVVGLIACCITLLACETPCDHAMSAWEAAGKPASNDNPSSRQVCAQCGNMDAFCADEVLAARRARAAGRERSDGSGGAADCAADCGNKQAKCLEDCTLVTLGTQGQLCNDGCQAKMVDCRAGCAN